VEAVSVARPSQTVALIRPDGYIAWAGGPVTGGHDAPAIRSALALVRKPGSRTGQPARR